MRFSWPIHLLIWLSLETLTSTITTGLPILVELIDLVSSAIFFLSHTTLFRWLTFLLGSETAILTVLLFCIYFFSLMLVFVLQWISHYWEILIMLLSFHWLSIIFTRGYSIALLMTILVLIGAVFAIIWEMFHGTISLKWMLLLLLVNFMSGFRLKLMYISLIRSIRASLIHLTAFQRLVLLS